VGAVQTKGGGALRQYEVLFILPPDADESVVQGALDRIARTISEAGGQLGKVDRWGRRRLAYAIAHQTEGYYVVAGFTADPDVIRTVERALQLADEVLRYKVVVRGEAA
jgi:small subunit ribosomal protein S6